MKNTAINSLKYTGIVTISRCIGTRKVKIAQIHNTGGSSLFDFLADCLIGEIKTANTRRPAKVMLLYRNTLSDGDTYYTYKPASGFIFLRTPPEKIDSNIQSKVRYSFIIPRDSLENLSSDAALCLGLYSHNASWDDPDNYLALCDFGKDLSAIQSGGASLAIDWDLIIANANTSSKTTATELPK